MEQIKCNECGFYVKNAGGNASCFYTGAQLKEEKRDSCLNFYPIQYDGKLPYSPEEHMYLYKSLKNSMQMTNRQGLRF